MESIERPNRRLLAPLPNTPGKAKFLLMALDYSRWNSVETGADVQVDFTGSVFVRFKPFLELSDWAWEQFETVTRPSDRRDGERLVAKLERLRHDYGLSVSFVIPLDKNAPALRATLDYVRMSYSAAMSADTIVVYSRDGYPFVEKFRGSEEERAEYHRRLAAHFVYSESWPSWSSRLAEEAKLAREFLASRLCPWSDW